MTQTEFTQRVLAMQDRLYRVSCTLLCCEADREDVPCSPRWKRRGAGASCCGRSSTWKRG